MSELPLVEIDASEGEGGGQIIRTALSLSAITKIPVHIFNIRSKRPNPGLRAQHLIACKSVRNICRGTLERAELNSSELVFHPGEIVGGDYEFDIGTAGSVVLVAQTLIPILLFANKKSVVRIKGGTHVMKSPSYDYFAEVFVPALRAFGIVIKTRVLKIGFYPVGGGEMEFEIKPNLPSGVRDWSTPAEPEGKRVLIRTSSSLPDLISIREKKVFVQNNLENVRISSDQTASPGNAILLWERFRGAFSLGEKGKRAEVVAQEAFDDFKKEESAKSDVDRHLADQLLIYAALANGETETRFKTSEISGHLRTNAETIKKFLKNKKIEINEEKKEVSVKPI